MKRIASGFGLLEGARWYPDWGLVFSDMTGGGVHALRSPADEPVTLVPHRKGVGGLVRHAEGGLVVAGRNVAHKRPGAEGSTVLLETRQDEQFFNDLGADRRGRLFAGTVAVGPPAGTDSAARPPGRLYCVGLDGEATVMADDVLVTNGIGTDPAGGRLYHVDSGRRTVWCFPLSDGVPGPGRELFVETSEYAGVPDGLAVAADGSVWVALAGGGVVVGWDENGRRVGELAVPEKLVTSVTFGGDAYTSFFVLTGTNHEHRAPDGGCAYVTDAGVTGLPSAETRVPVTGPGR